MKNNNIDFAEKIKHAKKYFKDGKFKEANDIYEEIIKRGIHSYDLLFSYGILNKEIKNYKLAKNIFLFTIKNYSSFINPYILLSEILRFENKFEESEKILLEANNINLLNSDVLYNLSLLYKVWGKFVKALNYINNAIKLSPNSIIYKILKAEILMNRGEYNSATALLSSIKNDDNKSIEIQKGILLSQTYLLQKNYLRSEKILLKLKCNYKRDIIIYLNLSNLYFIKKDLNKGILILKEGLSIFPEVLSLRFNLAVMYRNKGDIENSIKTFLEIIKRNNKHYDSFYELSTIYNFSDHKKEMNNFLKLDIDKLTSIEKIKVAFTKSNIYHNKNKFLESSFFIKVGNDERLKLYPSDFQLKFKIGKFYENLNLKDKKLDNNNSINDNYIFIVGMPRSGSTLLESILSLNSKVTDMGEVTFLEESLKESKEFSEIFSIYKNKKNFLYKNKGLFTDKNLFNFLYIPIIYNFFPNAKIIHCIRNPLDNILSIYKTNFLNQSFSSSLIDISNLFVYQTELMNKYKNKYGSILYSYYHDEVVLNPSQKIPMLIDWLNWDWDKKYLSPYKNKRAVYTASSAQVRVEFNSKSLGTWKDYKELLAPAIEIISKNGLLNFDENTINS